MTKKSTPKEFFGLENDFMFHAVLQESPAALKDLVSGLMGIPMEEIQSCQLENPIIYGEAYDAKDVELDVRLLLNNQVRLNLELQVRNHQAWPERSLLYWSRMYDSLREGEKYHQLKPAVHIGILGFTPFPEKPEFYSEYRLLNVKTGQEYTNKLILRSLDLTKTELASQTAQDQKLLAWARLFPAKTLEEFRFYAQGNEVFEEMAEVIERLNNDEIVRWQSFTRQIRKMDEYQWGFEAGEEKGRLEGEAKGRTEGKAEGIAAGKAEGMDTMSRLVAALLRDGRTEELKDAAANPILRDRLMREYGLEA